MTKDHDVWQAAALLFGVYGDRAVDYATTRMEALRSEEDSGEFETWAQITDKLRELTFSFIAERKPH